MELLAQRLPGMSASGVWFDAWHHNMGFVFLIEDMMAGAASATALRNLLSGLFADVARETDGDRKHFETADQILTGIEAFVMRRRKRLGL